jgi:hypothetical protein
MSEKLSMGLESFLSFIKIGQVIQEESPQNYHIVLKIT